MKNFVAVLMILGIGLFIVGCEEEKPISSDTVETPESTGKTVTSDPDEGGPTDPDGGTTDGGTTDGGTTDGGTTDGGTTDGTKG